MSDVVEFFCEQCRVAGLKMTHQRLEIFRELACTVEHPDAETVYSRVRERIPTISLDTVYRTLGMFENKGIIVRLGMPGNRARFDADTGRHHHFICSECGFIGDFSSVAFDGLEAPPEAFGLGLPGSVRVEVHGVCRSCAASGGRNRKAGRETKEQRR